MINFSDTSFYDKESKGYSEKRYNSTPKSFIQFCFQKRLKHVEKLVIKYKSKKEDQILIEDGCADGVVAQRVSKYFSKTIGTDISEGMIQQARDINKNPSVLFFVKHEFPKDIKANLFLAIGFVSPGIFKEEFYFIQEHLENGGIIIMSLVSSNSPYAKLKLKDREITKDYWTFKKYEEFLKKDFVILDSVLYGLFIPKLWTFPLIARIIQPICEFILKIFPILFHEKLYVLKKRG